MIKFWSYYKINTRCVFILHNQLLRNVVISIIRMLVICSPRPDLILNISSCIGWFLISKIVSSSPNAILDNVLPYTEMCLIDLWQFIILNPSPTLIHIQVANYCLSILLFQNYLAYWPHLYCMVKLLLSASPSIV